MKRLLLIIAAVALVMSVAAPGVLAADPGADHHGRVLMAFNGDVAVPAGDVAETVVVVTGKATIQGRVDSLVVVDGTALIDGATLGNVFVAHGAITLGAGTSVTGDVRTLDATVTREPTATVGGTTRAIDTDVVAFGAFIAPAVALFMLGFVLVTLVAGLALAAVASRQVRAAEALISREPGEALLVGLASLIVIPIVAILAMVTVIGAPLGLAILLMVWPAVAYVGYLVAGIWIGEWILRQSDPARTTQRPYFAALVGLVVLQIVSLLPLVAPIASLFGLGAVLLLAWRTFRQPDVARPVTTPTSVQPMGA